MAPRKFSEPSILDSRFSISGSRRLRRKGFTLIELIMIIILIAILASIAVPRFVNLGRQADIAATRGALGAIRAGMVMDYASRTLVARGTPKFARVIYSSWFFELDTPVNEITNNSVVNNAIGGADASVDCPAGTFPLGMKCGPDMTAALIDAGDLLARTTAAATKTACNTTGAEATPTTAWYYESTGDFEGVVKPCGDNSAVAGFTDDTADIW